MASDQNSSSISKWYKSLHPSKQNMIVGVQDTIISLFDIGYITVLYFVLGIILSVVVDKIYGSWSKQQDETKSIMRIGLELVSMIWLYGCITYIVRLLISYVPSPLSSIPYPDPDYRFNHYDLKELSSASVFTLILLGTSYHFKSKLEYFYFRALGIETQLNIPDMEVQI